MEQQYMQVVKAPNEFDEFNTLIFLAGSIEMGTAINWQDELVSHFQNSDITFLNPRRDDWDSSWTQSIDNEQFQEQVLWELSGIENSDLVVFVFDPNTKSPITLLELGLVAGMGQQAIVYCPDPFWRKGNVDIVSSVYDLNVVDSLEDLITYITKYWA